MFTYYHQLIKLHVMLLCICVYVFLPVLFCSNSLFSGNSWDCWRRRKTTNFVQSELKTFWSKIIKCQTCWGISLVLSLPFLFLCVLFFSDYHKKQNTLAALRKKALEKNPDEFYFKMISSKLEVRLLTLSEWRKWSQQSRHDLNTYDNTIMQCTILCVDRMEFTYRKKATRRWRWQRSRRKWWGRRISDMWRWKESQRLRWVYFPCNRSCTEELWCRRSSLKTEKGLYSHWELDYSLQNIWQKITDTDSRKMLNIGLDNRYTLRYLVCNMLENV